jgi:hypothetical protein
VQLVVAGEEVSCRAGNVNAAFGPPADVLFVDGSSGDPTFRIVNVTAGVPVTVSIATPPSGGNGHYALWTMDGEPDASTPTDIQLKSSSGRTIELGRGCMCLPINNTVTPGVCPCPLAFPTGRTSRALSAAKAAAVCVNRMPGFPKYPTSFTQTFPAGTYTFGGVIVDSGSASTKPISLMNWIVVVAQ